MNKSAPIQQLNAHEMIMISGGLSSPLISMPAEQAQALLGARYGIEGQLKRLATEKDDTFLVTCGDGQRYVAKLSNPDEDAGEISLEVDAIEHIATSDPDLPVPRVIRTLDGAQWFEHPDVHGQVRKVRLLSYMSGSLMQNFSLGSDQLEMVGKTAAKLRLALADFAHPCADRVQPWDIKQLPKISHLLDAVEAPEKEAVRTCIDRFLGIEGELAACRQQVLHNDFTTSNVLVDPAQPDLIAGIIDFGDVVRTYIVADLAVALLSQLPPSGNADMLDDARDFLRGYLAVADLTETELRLLPHLIAARLCTRILITTWRAKQFPDNAPYILRNQSGAFSRLNYFLSRSVEQVDRLFL